MERAKLILEYLRVLIWPATVLAICLVFRKQVVGLFSRIQRAQLPGGFSFDLAEGIQEAKALSSKVQEAPRPTHAEGRRGPTLPLTEANSRIIQLGLRPSPSGLDMSYYRNLAEQDPNVALAGLRIEYDVLARNLATGFKVPIERQDTGERLLRKLYDHGAITSEQMQLGLKVLQVCNATVHGQPVSLEQAKSVIQSAEVLADQYLSWLSWGFDDGWEPGGGING